MSDLSIASFEWQMSCELDTEGQSHERMFDIVRQFNGALASANAIAARLIHDGESLFVSIEVPPGVIHVHMDASLTNGHDLIRDIIFAVFDLYNTSEEAFELLFKFGGAPELQVVQIDRLLAHTL